MIKALADRVLEHASVYRLWMAPFAEKKLAPVLAHNDLRAVRRILDVGCGPGTNTAHFMQVDYLGLDKNPAYIEYARRRFRRPFVIADVTTYAVDRVGRFDFILVNSLLHHLDDAGTRHVLSHLGTLLTDNGHVHIIELVIPPEPSVAQRLARWDRGKFARPLDEWRAMFCEYFVPVVDEPFTVGMIRMDLWHFVYFKGRPKRS